MLPCWIKWLLSGAAAPASALLLVVAALVIAAIAAAAVAVPMYLLSLGWDRYASARAKHAADLFLGDPHKSARHGSPALRILAAGALVAIVYTGAPEMMQRIFGCNECLPDAMREKCTATLTELDAKDRADLDRICSSHPAWCTPVAQENP